MSKEKSSIVLVVIIVSATVLAAIIFSFLTYESYVRNSNEIQDISLQNIRNTALIKVSDLSLLLENKLNSVIGSLEVVSSSPGIIDQDLEKGKIVLDMAQNSTEDIVDSYYWFDSNGTNVWSSSYRNKTIYEKFKGFSIASHAYFKEVKDTHAPVYSDTQEWLDLRPKIFTVYPILDTENSTVIENNNKQIFKGAVLAAINPNILGQFLENQLSPLSTASISLVNPNGLTILEGTPEFFGINIFDPRSNSLSERFVIDNNNASNLIEEIRSAILNSKTFSIDILANGQDLTVAYAPVLLNGKRLLTIILALPHIPEASVENLVLLQRNFGLVAMITTAIISFGVFYAVTNWHKELRKEVQRQKKDLEQTAEKLTIKDQVQKEFIDIAAHEFRTPIQSVLGYSEMIQSTLKNFDNYFERIFRNAKRLEKMTDDILVVSKIDTKNLQLSKVNFNLNETIKEVIDDHQKEALNRNAKIIFEPKKDIGDTIYADESRIQQVIDNLLSNALNFTKDGTITITIDNAQIDTDAENSEHDRESIIVEIMDTGTGINPEIVSRLFEKFATRSEAGTGLGLYISKSIVDSHGGKIWAYNNRDGKGATFTFELPISEKK